MRKDGVLTLFAILVLSAVAQAEVYKWVDDLGNVVYSQSPPPDSRDVDTVVVPPPPRLEHSAEEPAQQAVGQGAPANAAVDDATRKAYCDIGRRNLKLLADSSDKSLFRTESGEDVRYTAEEIAAKIKENQNVVKAYCD